MNSRNILNNDFSCKNYADTLSSLAFCFGVNTADIEKEFNTDYLEKFNSMGSEKYSKYKDDSDYVYEQLRSKFSIKRYPYRIHWYHGTRLPKNHRIYQEGLLPLNMIYKRLFKTIDAYAIKYSIPRSENTSSMSSEIIVLKMDNPYNLGPCAWLIREAAVSPKLFGANRSYIENGSEIIQDYIDSEYYDFYNQLFSLFCADYSQKSVVEFFTYWDELNNFKIKFDDILKGSFLYCYFSARKKNDDDGFTEACNCPFSGLGKIIPGDHIVRVETFT